MKTRLYAALVVLFLLTTRNVPAHGQSRWGLGLILGEPTGISYKNWSSNDRAIDLAAAWSFSGYDSFQIHADYLFHNFTWKDDTDIRGTLPIYYGLGARIKLGDNRGFVRAREDKMRIGVRIPGGLAYFLEEAPIEFFIEIVPLFDFLPDTRFDVNGAIGARYYFE